MVFFGACAFPTTKIVRGALWLWRRRLREERRRNNGASKPSLDFFEDLELASYGRVLSPISLFHCY